ncbi:MAG TPA: PIG-L family deacetylase [Aldersonia sp.]
MPLTQTPPDDPGTAEDDWQRWGTRFPDLDLRECKRLVVVAPHPDDETVGVGGLMATCVEHRIPVAPVAVTDGEASHPDYPPWPPPTLARMRIAEMHGALTTLGVAAAPVRLGLPDGDVAGHQPALATALTNLLSDAPADTWCAATWRGDGHPDHDAVGRAAAIACRAADVRLLEYPIWMWHWARPGDPSIPWAHARSVPLTPQSHLAKLTAIRSFRSQTEPPPAAPDLPPVLPGHILAHWRRPHETVFA